VMDRSRHEIARHFPTKDHVLVVGQNFFLTVINFLRLRTAYERSGRFSAHISSSSD